MTWADLAVVGALVVGWAAVSKWAGRIGVTAPMLFVAAGVALGGERVLHVTLSSSTMKVCAELTLVMVLFADAARVRLPSLRQDVGLPLRLLGIGMPLTVGLGALLDHWVFGSFGVWMAVLVAACLAPTDAGLGAGIVTDQSVPSRVRRALNVESGLNDGLVAPLVALGIAAVAGEMTGASGTSLLHAAREIGIGVLIGIGGGLVVGWLLAWTNRQNWTDSGAGAVATVAAAIGTYSAAVALHGNGFVAAFLAGLCFGVFQHEVGPQPLELTEGLGQLLACLVWFAFGAAMLRPALTSPEVLRALGYAVLSLTVVRMLPVALALFRTHVGLATVAFVGWFGPRGLASVIFALLAFDALGHESSTLLATVSITVALSVVVHGLSANPLISRYGAAGKSRDPDHPLQVHVAVPPVRRTFGAAPSTRPPHAA
jgi:NhaP-type Na+/H+ or K+/H+ antiporter